MPPSSMNEYSSARKPIDTPRTSLAFTDCQAMSTKSLRAPGSAITGRLAVNGMPFFVALPKVAMPTGLSCWCCQSKGISFEGRTHGVNDVADTVRLGRGRHAGD